MKNRDIVLILSIALAGLFLWQLINNLSKTVENVSTTNKTRNDQINQSLRDINFLANDSQVMVQNIQANTPENTAGTVEDFENALIA